VTLQSNAAQRLNESSLITMASPYANLAKSLRRRPFLARRADELDDPYADFECFERGANPRYRVTNLEGRPGTMRFAAVAGDENRIKEQQLGLFSDRTSCHG
jgi:hypothetical protein